MRGDWTSMQYLEQRGSEYAQTKYEGDLVAWQISKNQNLPLVMVYPGGAGDRVHPNPGRPRGSGCLLWTLSAPIPQLIID